ncbi:Probable phosphohydrolase [Flavobacterium indicum GPTSA100-9 = DSM 17447]|uniref:Probable phosphohydrolase n=1 Tax=Flavobacterium indicum (strain DSM 17447 / CIP 109464 / GPTSA100-9) TaxID=1094466 RepID=H8XQS3_FLAIG|nr:HD domain-containing protein [Flavobacterium indicum]CCG53371.1 Probable phosphohydrolase [Flavobacterium indicum GPTSA100-9 = DSM 17447]
MSQINKLKILNDPIYGFVTIPNTLIYDLIQHPYFQRLRRISQMGMSYLVYPGAHHTRFHHALGCMHIMQKAVQTLRFKGVSISNEEENALYVTILLHDIGHGPFSHALEHSVIEVHHEELSLLFMEQLNKEFDGKLSLAIQIFKGEYHRKFMLQLISSQLDMDRMDYLKRDSFYTGVNEGNVNSERLIQMLNVKDDFLVMEEKGIYSIEKFLMARRLMYWQAYLHKTSVVAELILTKILKRAKELVVKGEELFGSSFLINFMKNKFELQDVNKEVLDQFSNLDDYDVLGAIKQWQFHNDFVLSSLCKMLINRHLLKIEITEDKIDKIKYLELKEKYISEYNLLEKDIEYFVFKGKLKNEAYSKSSEPIRILKKDGTIENVVEASDQMHLKALSKPVTKYFICYPKVID